MSDQGGYIHINRPSSTRYFGMVKRRGHRKWERLGPSFSKNMQKVAKEVAAKMASDYGYKRGCVCVIADYYDPSSVLDMVRP